MAEITYVRFREGFLYLGFTLDASSCRIAGWSMATHLRTKPVVDALQMAIAPRQAFYRKYRLVYADPTLRQAWRGSALEHPGSLVIAEAQGVGDFGFGRAYCSPSKHLEGVMNCWKR